MLVETHPLVHKQDPLEHHNRNKEAKERSPTQEKKRHYFEEFLEMTAKMMNDKDANSFKKGADYAVNLLKFIKGSPEKAAISQETLNDILFDGVKRYKENMSGPRQDSFGRTVNDEFDFVSLFEEKRV